MRNKYRARQIDRDSAYLVKSQKPLSGPMREKSWEYVCWVGKEYITGYEIQRSGSGPQVPINTKQM